jgi:hypothetical protein
MKSPQPREELVTVYEAANVVAARIVAQALEDEGIKCRLGDENQGGFPGLSQVEGVEILVLAEDADRARKIIEKREPREDED